MTNELEKQFFDTFGIDKRIEFETCYAMDSCKWNAHKLAQEALKVVE